MKRFKEFFISLILVFSLMFSCTATFTASAKDTVNEYAPFLIEEDILDAWGAFTEKEQPDYAGVYIDGDVIIMRFKEGTDSLKNEDIRNIQNHKVLVSQSKQLQQAIMIEPAAYSYQELMTVYHYLVNNVYSLKGISSVSLSNKGNCIDIGISSDSHWSELQKDLLMMIQTNTDVKNITDNSILSFHTVKPEDEFSYAVSINGNSHLQTNTIYYSAAVGQYSSTYGRGFITTGHGPSVGDAVKYGSTTIGY